MMSLKKFLIHWSIRERQLLLILTILLPAIGIVIYSGLKEHQEEIDNARNQAMLLTQSLAAQQEQVTASIRELLSTLAKLPAVQQLNVGACNALFRELNQQSPRYSTIGLVTPDGNLIAASTDFNAGSVNLSDRKHIRDAIASQDFSVGEYIIGRVSKVQTINYTYPVLNAEHRLIAIVVAGVRLDAVADFLSQVKIPEDSVVALSDHRGVRMLRLPENNLASAGKPLPSDAFEQLSKPPSHGFFERPGEDGNDRIYAYKGIRLKEKAPPYLFLSVGIPKNEVLLHANMQMLNNLLILGLATFLAAALSWLFATLLVAKPFRQLVAASNRFGKGDIAARTGLPHTASEFGRLAKAFDEMAELLETREKERDRAEEALRDANAGLETRVMMRTMELSEANAALEIQIREHQMTTALLDNIIENIPNMIFVKDAEALRFVRINKAGEQLLGFSRNELLGKNDYDFFPEQQADFFTDKDRDVLTGKAILDIPEEFLESRSMGTRILHTKKVPLSGPGGKAEYLLGISEDITGQKRAEEALRLSLEEKISLLKEVHHRVKNNLQVVISLLNLQTGRSENPDVTEVLTDMGNRVYSMALLHEILYRSDNLARIRLPDYMEELCTQLLRSSSVEPGRVVLERRIDDISLPMEQAVPYALIVNELVSNALKHGFSDGRSGKILVSTTLTEDGQVHLSVFDDGIGIPSGEDPVRKQTLGLQLVSRLACQLNGQLDFGRGNKSGACFNVEFPLSGKQFTGA